MDGQAMAGQIVALPLRLGQPQQPHEHCGHPLAVGHPVTVDECQARGRVEAFHDHAGAAATLHHVVVAQRRRMIERRGGQVDGVRADLVQGHPALEQLRDRARRCAGAGGAHPFRPSCGAGGIQHLGPLGGIRRQSFRLAGDQLRPAVHVQPDRLWRAFGLVRLTGVQHQCPGVAVVEDVLNLAAQKLHAHRRVVQARQLCRPVHGKGVRVVGGEDGDTVAGAEPQRAQEPRAFHRHGGEGLIADDGGRGGRLVRRASGRPAVTPARRRRAEVSMPADPAAPRPSAVARPRSARDQSRCRARVSRCRGVPAAGRA